MTAELKPRQMECGCIFNDAGEFAPCHAHLRTPLHKVRLDRAEIMFIGPCPNCGNVGEVGECLWCGLTDAPQTHQEAPRLRF